MQLDSAELTAVVHRLRRVQGQIGGVLKLLESGADCADVITQLSAASKALDRAGFVIIASGLEQCISRGDDAAGVDRAKLQKLFLSLA
ncbi:MAG TPA: metal-sensitive transcriptional regulator [Actinotalea sp.]|nr:metal-sensitive transcriptional regulator [Actinotalea sp.]